MKTLLVLILLGWGASSMSHAVVVWTINTKNYGGGRHTGWDFGGESTDFGMVHAESFNGYPILDPFVGSNHSLGVGVANRGSGVVGQPSYFEDGSQLYSAEAYVYSFAPVRVTSFNSLILSLNILNLSLAELPETEIRTVSFFHAFEIVSEDMTDSVFISTESTPITVDLHGGVMELNVNLGTEYVIPENYYFLSYYYFHYKEGTDMRISMNSLSGAMSIESSVPESSSAILSLFGIGMLIGKRQRDNKTS